MDDSHNCIECAIDTSVLVFADSAALHCRIGLKNRGRTARSLIPGLTSIIRRPIESNNCYRLLSTELSAGVEPVYPSSFGAGWPVVSEGPLMADSSRPSDKLLTGCFRCKRTGGKMRMVEPLLG